MSTVNPPLIHPQVYVDFLAYNATHYPERRAMLVQSYKHPASVRIWFNNFLPHEYGLADVAFIVVAVQEACGSPTVPKLLGPGHMAMWRAQRRTQVQLELYQDFGAADVGYSDDESSDKGDEDSDSEPSGENGEADEENTE